MRLTFVPSRRFPPQARSTSHIQTPTVTLPPQARSASPSSGRGAAGRPGTRTGIREAPSGRSSSRYRAPSSAPSFLTSTSPPVHSLHILPPSANQRRACPSTHFFGVALKQNSQNFTLVNFSLSPNFTLVITSLCQIMRVFFTRFFFTRNIFRITTGRFNGVHNCL